LDTSRNSVVNFGRLLKTVLVCIDEIEGDIVKEDRLEPVNVPPAIVDSVLLRNKSKEPERFTQPFNALSPSVLNDIGAKVSTPVPLQFWNAFAPILVILEEKEAFRRMQPFNAYIPIDVKFCVLYRLCILDAFQNV